MCIRSMGSRRDCTEAFLSTTSAVSPPRLWPLPPMSSWSRSSTWTNRCFCTCQVCTWACTLQVIKRIDLNASFVEWSEAHPLRLKLFNVGTAFSLSSLEAPGKSVNAEKGNWISDSKALHVCPISFPLTSCFCDSPPLKRGFTQDMWLEFEQLPHQCLHGYGGAAASLVRLGWLDGLGQWYAL